MKTVWRVGMPLVDETARDGSGSRVQIFVGTPNGEIRVPVVQFQDQIADVVGQVSYGKAMASYRKCLKG